MPLYAAHRVSSAPHGRYRHINLMNALAITDIPPCEGKVSAKIDGRSGCGDLSSHGDAMSRAARGLQCRPWQLEVLCVAKRSAVGRAGGRHRREKVD